MKKTVIKIVGKQASPDQTNEIEDEILCKLKDKFQLGIGETIIYVNQNSETCCVLDGEYDEAFPHYETIAMKRFVENTIKLGKR